MNWHDDVCVDEQTGSRRKKGKWQSLADENGNDHVELVGAIFNTADNPPGTPGTKEKRGDIFQNAGADVQCQDGVVTSYDWTSVFASLERRCSKDPSVDEKHNQFVTTGGATAYTVSLWWGASRIHDFIGKRTHAMSTSLRKHSAVLVRNVLFTQLMSEND